MFNHCTHGVSYFTHTLIIICLCAGGFRFSHHTQSCACLHAHFQIFRYEIRTGKQTFSLSESFNSEQWSLNTHQFYFLGQGDLNLFVQRTIILTRQHGRKQLSLFVLFRGTLRSAGGIKTYGAHWKKWYKQYAVNWLCHACETTWGYITMAPLKTPRSWRAERDNKCKLLM